MKLLISIVSYLLKDIFWRWREQPGNVFTRFILAYALVLPSLALLGAFVLMTGSIEAKLRKTGTDMLFVTEHVSAMQGDIAANQKHVRMAPLAKHGTMFQLLQLFTQARSPYATSIRVAAYPDSALHALEGMVSAEYPVAYLSEKLLENVPIRVSIDNFFFMARTARPDGMVDKYFQGDLVLLPEGMLPRLESRGFMRVTLCRIKNIEEIETLQRAVQLTSKLDETKVYVRSSIKLLESFSMMKERQLFWRLGLAAAAGSVLALVLGTLSLLEYQQRAYVIALLRSFGIKRRLVLVMQLFESALVVNLAGITAYYTLIVCQQTLYRSFGSEGGVNGLTFEHMTTELLLIFACINIGVLISTAPSIHILKKDIGTILS